MKNLLAASALILAIAAPAAAQTMDTGMDAGSSTIHRTRDQGATTNQTQTLSDGGIDTSTTQSIAPMADYGMRAGRDDSSPMREDTSDNNSRAVGGRSN